MKKRALFLFTIFIISLLAVSVNAKEVLRPLGGGGGTITVPDDEVAKSQVNGPVKIGDGTIYGGEGQLSDPCKAKGSIIVEVKDLHEEVDEGVEDYLSDPEISDNDKKRFRQNVVATSLGYKCDKYCGYDSNNPVCRSRITELKYNIENPPLLGGSARCSCEKRKEMSYKPSKDQVARLCANPSEAKLSEDGTLTVNGQQLEKGSYQIVPVSNLLVTSTTNDCDKLTDRLNDAIKSLKETEEQIKDLDEEISQLQKKIDNIDNNQQGWWDWFFGSSRQKLVNELAIKNIALVGLQKLRAAYEALVEKLNQERIKCLGKIKSPSSSYLGPSGSYCSVDEMPSHNGYTEVSCVPSDSSSGVLAQKVLRPLGGGGGYIDIPDNLVVKVNPKICENKDFDGVVSGNDILAVKKSGDVISMPVHNPATTKSGSYASVSMPVHNPMTTKVDSWGAAMPVHNPMTTKVDGEKLNLPEVKDNLIKARSDRPGFVRPRETIRMSSSEKEEIDAIINEIDDYFANLRTIGPKPSDDFAWLPPDDIPPGPGEDGEILFPKKVAHLAIILPPKPSGENPLDGAVCARLSYLRVGPSTPPVPPTLPGLAATSDDCKSIKQQINNGYFYLGMAEEKLRELEKKGDIKGAAELRKKISMLKEEIAKLETKYKELSCEDGVSAIPPTPPHLATTTSNDCQQLLAEIQRLYDEIQMDMKNLNEAIKPVIDDYKKLLKEVEEKLRQETDLERRQEYKEGRILIVDFLNHFYKLEANTLEKIKENTQKYNELRARYIEKCQKQVSAIPKKVDLASLGVASDLAAVVDLNKKLVHISDVETGKPVILAAGYDFDKYGSYMGTKPETNIPHYRTGTKGGVYSFANENVRTEKDFGYLVIKRTETSPLEVVKNVEFLTIKKDPFADLECCVTCSYEKEGNTKLVTKKESCPNGFKRYAKSCVNAESEIRKDCGEKVSAVPVIKLASFNAQTICDQEGQITEVSAILAGDLGQLSKVELAYKSPESRSFVVEGLYQNQVNKNEFYSSIPNSKLASINDYQVQVSTKDGMLLKLGSGSFEAETCQKSYCSAGEMPSHNGYTEVSCVPVSGSYCSAGEMPSHNGYTEVSCVPVNTPAYPSTPYSYVG